MGNLIRLIAFVLIIKFVESNEHGCFVRSRCEEEIVEGGKKDKGISDELRPYFTVNYESNFLVTIRCHNSPDWSAFDVKSLVGSAQILQFVNCFFEDNIDLMKVATNAGAQDAEELLFKSESKKKFIISNSNLKRFAHSNLKKITFSNMKMEKIPEDLFEGLTNLNAIVFRSLDLHEPVPTLLFSKLSNLSFIELGGASITDLKDDLFTGLSNLRELHLRLPNLEDIPGKLLKSLSNLRKFYLYDSKIEMIKHYFFYDLVNLKELSIGSSNLLDISELLDQLPSLEKFYLTSSKIKAIPENLKIQNLTDISINSSEIKTLKPESFRLLSNLKRIELNLKNLEVLPEALLEGMSELITFKVKSSEFPELPVKLFEGSSNLRDIEVENSKIVKLDEEIFKQLPNLERIELNLENLKKLPKSLLAETLKLRKFQLKSSNVRKLHSKIFNGLRNCTQTVNLYLNNLEELPVALIQGMLRLEAFRISSNIRELPNKFFDELPRLAYFFVESPRLENVPAKILDDHSRSYTIKGKREWIYNKDLFKKM